jgi:hypothetical protein
MYTYRQITARPAFLSACVGKALVQLFLLSLSQLHEHLRACPWAAAERPGQRLLSSSAKSWAMSPPLRQQQVRRLGIVYGLVVLDLFQQLRRSSSNIPRDLLSDRRSFFAWKNKKPHSRPTGTAVGTSPKTEIRPGGFSSPFKL